MKNYIVTTLNGKTMLITSTSQFAASNKVKASGSQPTLVLEL